ncbi:MAG: ABC transporter ATP-binding protein [Steroidobacteraceae bacterium]
MIEIRNVSKTYRRGDGTPVHALQEVSFHIARGEFVTIRGASGSGKSSLLNILGCLDTPSTGQYLFEGQDVSALDDAGRSHLRCRRIGFVFQSFNLLPRTTAVENVEVPAMYAGGRIDQARALAILAQVGLGHRGEHYVSELSGGEQQRVAIARALMNDPPLILADEPTGNLDSAAGEAVMELLCQLHQQGRTIVLVTHDEHVASFAARELLIRDGRLASDRALPPRRAAADAPGPTAAARGRDNAAPHGG